VSLALSTYSEEKQVEDWYLNTYERDPLRWIYDYLEIKDGLWEKQEEIISSVFEHTYTAVRSGHSIGKSCSAALATLAFLYTQVPSKVITTAPTFRQVSKILWREIRKFYYKRKLYEGKRVNFGGRLLTIELINDEDWFALGIHPREWDLDAFQGYHSENILIILDESPGVSEDLYEAANSLMASDNAHMLEIGNPAAPSGHFYRAFQPKSDYHKISISCLDSPNLKAGKVVRPYLVTQAWVDGMRKRHGEGHPFYQSKVLGEFPSSKETSFVPLSWVEEAMR